MYSAGILPITIIRGDIYVLIGRESYDRTYSDFGGKYETIDKSIIETACREFKEESLYDKISMRDFHNMWSVYTESRTLKGNIYYMFLVYMHPHIINDIYINFNDLTKKSRLARSCNSNIRCEKARLKLIMLNKLLSSRSKDQESTEDHELTEDSWVTRDAGFTRDHLDPRYPGYPGDTGDTGDPGHLQKEYNVCASYKLRHVFENTLRMHKHFLKTLDESIITGIENDDNYNNIERDLDDTGWIVAKSRKTAKRYKKKWQAINV